MPIYHAKVLLKVLSILIKLPWGYWEELHLKAHAFISVLSQSPARGKEAQFVFVAKLDSQLDISSTFWSNPFGPKVPGCLQTYFCKISILCDTFSYQHFSEWQIIFNKTFQQRT